MQSMDAKFSGQWGKCGITWWAVFRRLVVHHAGRVDYVFEEEEEMG